jgi:hypothetical protein
MVLAKPEVRSELCEVRPSRENLQLAKFFEDTCTLIWIIQWDGARVKSEAQREIANSAVDGNAISVRNSEKLRTACALSECHVHSVVRIRDANPGEPPTSA